MRLIAVVAALGLVAGLSETAEAKEGVIARLRAPLPADAQPGTTIVVSWILGIPTENEPPFNACGVFVQLKSASGASSTRAYADGPGAAAKYPDVPVCRAHPTGEYEATILVPDGGIGGIEIGVSGTSDAYFPVVVGSPTAAPAAPRTQPLLGLASLAALIGLVVIAGLFAARRLASSRGSSLI
jgi:hypothetical protein